jgi:hypothetical protein
VAGSTILHGSKKWDTKNKNVKIKAPKIIFFKYQGIY